MQPEGESRSRAPHAYRGLDRVLHEKARLGILIALLNRPEGVLFADLRGLCELTDGNLHRHLAVLHDAGIVELWKSQDAGRPRTLVRLSRRGRSQFVAYLAELERVLEDARGGEEVDRARKRSPGSGWAPA